jgi:apolipoprotein N-acyltransferase
MRNWPAAVADLTGWRRYGLALLAGVLAAGALPPLNIVPLLIPAFVVLVWMIDGSRRKRAAFAAGWWFGFGHFVAGLHWTAFALTADPSRNFIWLIPFAVSGIPAGLAFFTGFATLAAKLARQSGWRRVIALALAWTAAEWLRGHVLTGFPWNLVGYTWTSIDSVLQITSVVGIYGLGLLTVAVMAMPASIWADPRGVADDVRVSVRRWMPATTAVALLALVTIGGAMRLGAGELRWQDGVNLRVVQANIPQQLKWQRDRREANLLQHVDMSLAAAEVAPTAVIWPETASTFALDDGGPVARVIGSAAPPGGVVLTGAPRTTGRRGQDFALRNSLHIVDSESRLLDTYDKSHLVPFGEYLPLRGLLSIIGLDKVTAGALDYSAGAGRGLSGHRAYPRLARLSATRSSSPARWLILTTGRSGCSA